jgi:DNA-binding MarR family transcriptional regulator
VERGAHPTDARARTVALTADGRRVVRRLWVVGEPIRARMLGALRPDEVDTLVDLLARVADALNSERAPGGGSIASYSRGDKT